MNLDESIIRDGSIINDGVFLKRILKDNEDSFFNKFESLPSETIGIHYFSEQLERDLALHDLNIQSLFYELIKLYQMWESRKKYIFESVGRIRGSVRACYHTFSVEPPINQDPLMSEIARLVTTIYPYLDSMYEYKLKEKLSSFTKEIFNHFDPVFLHKSIFLEKVHKDFDQANIINVLLLVQIAREYIFFLEPIVDELNCEIKRIEIRALGTKSSEIKSLYELCYTIKTWFKEVKELTDAIILFQEFYLSICFLFIPNFKGKSVKVFEGALRSVRCYTGRTEKDNKRLAKARKEFFIVQRSFFILEEEYHAKSRKYDVQVDEYTEERNRRSKIQKRDNIPTQGEYYMKIQEEKFMMVISAFKRDQKRLNKARKRYEKAQIKSDAVHKEPKIRSNFCQALTNYKLLLEIPGLLIPY